MSVRFRGILQKLVPNKPRPEPLESSSHEDTDGQHITYKSAIGQNTIKPNRTTKILLAIWFVLITITIIADIAIIIVVSKTENTINELCSWETCESNPENLRLAISKAYEGDFISKEQMTKMETDLDYKELYRQIGNMKIWQLLLTFQIISLAATTTLSCLWFKHKKNYNRQIAYRKTIFVINLGTAIVFSQFGWRTLRFKGTLANIYLYHVIKSAVLMTLMPMPSLILYFDRTNRAKEFRLSTEVLNQIFKKPPSAGELLSRGAGPYDPAPAPRTSPRNARNTPDRVPAPHKVESNITELSDLPKPLDFPDWKALTLYQKSLTSTRTSTDTRRSTRRSTYSRLSHTNPNTFSKSTFSKEKVSHQSHFEISKNQEVDITEGVLTSEESMAPKPNSSDTEISRREESTEPATTTTSKFGFSLAQNARVAPSRSADLIREAAAALTKPSSFFIAGGRPQVAKSRRSPSSGTPRSRTPSGRRKKTPGGTPKGERFQIPAGFNYEDEEAKNPWKVAAVLPPGAS